jgi:PLP dependent protein
MPELIRRLDPERVRRNLDRVRERAPDVEVLAATKYVPVEELGALAEAGVTLVGENRLQDLEAKRERWAEAFEWDFIGAVQSRKLKAILPLTRFVHSIASDSALRQLELHAAPETEVLLQVNLSGESSKEGIDASDVPDFIARCPVRAGGLMTMPPFTEDPEASRPHFVALRELAEAHGLRHLSMGTSQDYAVAAQEGATIVRIGSILFG